MVLGGYSETQMEGGVTKASPSPPRRGPRDLACSLAVLLGVSIVGLGEWSVPAHSIPAFARQLDAQCSLCHAPLPPRLNNYGLLFRRMGFRLPDDDEGQLIFKPLPAHTPYEGTSTITDFRLEKKEGDPGQMELHEFEVLSAGNLGEEVSYFTEFEYNEEGEVEWALGEAQYNQGLPESSFFARLGLMDPVFWQKGNHQRLTASRPLLINTRVSAGAFRGFRMRQTLVGLEVGKAWNQLSEAGGIRSTIASVGLFNGVTPKGSVGQSDTDGDKDVLAQVYHLWGENNTAGLLWYHGTGRGLDDPDTMEADESSRDTFNRVAAFGNYTFSPGTDLQVGALWGRDSSSGPGGVGRFNTRGFYLEASHPIREQVAGVVRWDHLKIGGNSTRAWMVGLDYQPQNNLMLRLDIHAPDPGKDAVTLQVWTLF